MDRWVGKTAVVTGASAGIGAAICVALANKGVRVVGLARRAARVEALESKGVIIARICDVSNTEQVAATFEWIEESFGAVHIMINNAGVFHTGGFSDAGNDMISEEDMLATVDINVKGPMLCARRALTSMKNHGIDGHIVNINSIAGHYIPMDPTFNIYPSTKHAVTGFTASLLSELAHHNNRTKVTLKAALHEIRHVKKPDLSQIQQTIASRCSNTSLSPGLTMTDMAGIAQLKALKIAALNPEDVADAVLYVLSTPPHVNINELTITSVTEKRA